MLSEMIPIKYANEETKDISPITSGVNFKCSVK